MFLGNINSIFFSRTEPNTVAGDKLSPGTNPGFLKSEENVKLHTFIYIKSVSENICVYNNLFQHFDSCGNVKNIWRKVQGTSEGPLPHI